MSDEKIKQLQEMGFSQEQAANALKVSNNVLEVAIAHLFGEPVEQPQENKENTQLVPYNENDTVQISNPLDIPKFPSYRETPTSSNGGWSEIQDEELIENYEDEDDNDNDDDLVDQWTNNSKQASSETIFDYPQAFTRLTEMPPCVLPKVTGTLQSCLISLIVTLSQIGELRNVFFSKDFDYGFDENWYTPTTELTVETPEKFKDNSFYSFVVEIQRIFGFLSPKVSNRSFISGKNLFKSLPEDFAIDDDDWEDVIKKVHRYIALGSESILDKDLTLVFLSQVESNGEETTDLSILQIEYEARNLNLQASLNSLIWNSELNPVFTKLGLLLTIQMFGGDEDDDDDGRCQALSFEIPEYFYPGIFTSTYQEIIAKMNQKKLNATKERSSITTKLLGFSSFEGKKIKKILQNSIDYLATTDSKEAHDDLKRLSEKVQNESLALNDRLKFVNQEYLKMDVKNPDNILEIIEKEDLPPPEKYYLTSVIISDSEYIYKAKHFTTTDFENEDWLYIVIDLDHNNKVLEYRTETMSFEALQLFILEETKLNRRQLILHYVAESSLQDLAKVPEKLVEFFDKDNQLLAEEVHEFNKNNKENDAEVSNDSSVDESFLVSHSETQSL